MSRWWRWLRGWRKPQRAPFFINGVSRPWPASEVFTTVLHRDSCNAEFDVVVSFNQQLFGERDPSHEIEGLRGIL